jgi:8-oxo-dGTP pyrophosphatase MutT (NUDIX family)
VSADWQLKREPLADYRIFQVLRKSGRSPRTGQPVDFYAIEAPAWVQVIPITRDGKLIMVEQFRPGAEVISLEFPAGLVDRDESAEAAAARELTEETGFSADSIQELGSLYANPAIQSNRLHVLLAENCRRTGEPQQDEGEDVQVRLFSADQIPTMIRSGEINHALVLTAWQLYELWRVQRPASRT